MNRSLISLLLAICAVAASGPAFSQPVRPGSIVRINPGGSMEQAPAQPDKAFRPEEREKAMGKNPENGCACSSNNRCAYSLDFNYCIARDGSRVFIQRFWGQ